MGSKRPVDVEVTPDGHVKLTVTGIVVDVRGIDVDGPGRAVVVDLQPSYVAITVDRLSRAYCLAQAIRRSKGERVPSTPIDLLGAEERNARRTRNNKGAK